MKNDQISGFLSERITAGDFPSAVYLVAQGDEVIFSDAIGHSVIEPYRIATTTQTIYDLASLTKPLITALLCCRRMELGELTLDSSVSHYLPEFDRTDKHMITIRELTTHTSGLPAWQPLYILAENDRDRAPAAIANLDLEYKPGSRVVYSDLGFIALGFLVERLSHHERLAQLATTEIINALGLEHTFFNPEAALQTGIAACETGNAYEHDMCEPDAASQYKNWRSALIWGEVHDGNAYFLGGAAGHAGLFSTAEETWRLAQQFLAQRSKLLKPETCELFRKNMTPGLEEARTIGWQLAASPESTAGLNLPRDSFGHTGFTGTSCWIDPQHERVFILLTNRTHAHAIPFTNINAVRRQFHSMAAAALDDR
ncbi:MAG TPA: serine hydrolase [Pyrinomonadaceae bacterium]|nr:serine hydrolase [Pyrinomonadaceae bacterium]